MEREGLEDREEGRLGVVLAIEGTKGTWLVSSESSNQMKHEEA